MDYGRVLEGILEDSGRFWVILARIATLEMAAFFCGCHFWVLSCLLLFFESILGKHSTWLYCLLLLALTCCCLLLGPKGSKSWIKISHARRLLR